MCVPVLPYDNTKQRDLFPFFSSLKYGYIIQQLFSVRRLTFFLQSA
jgi:hypothetical protein